MDYKEVESLIKLLDDPDIEISRHVEHRLLSYGSAVIKNLEQAWDLSPDAVLQKRIEHLIHSIQFQATKADLTHWIAKGSFDLLKGLIIINRYQYPELDEQRIINKIEVLKRDIWMQLTYEMSPFEKVKLINNVLYSTYGFSGNTTNHKDPRNSYMSQVLETKKGNQISLATIYIIIAQRLDIPIYGVNLPQHFILAYIDETKKSATDNGILFYINAFNKGFIFGRDEVDTFLKQLKLSPNKEFYEPCDNVEIIKRVLRNLISSYQINNIPEKVAELSELLELF